MYKVEMFTHYKGQLDYILHQDFEDANKAREFKNTCQKIFPQFTVVFTDMNFSDKKDKWLKKRA
jgi:hypothetical protein